MIEFRKLGNGSTFNVPFWEIQPSDNEELRQKYCLRMFQEGPRKTLTFVKDGIYSCHDVVTKTMFYLDENKMESDKTGLSFYATFVDNSLNQLKIDNNLVREYFDDATRLKGKGRVLIQK